MKSIATELPPLLDIPVALLIGIDCSAAFIPIATKVGDKDEAPFAIRTVLGWTMCGGKGGCDRKRRSNGIQIAKVLSALEPDFDRFNDENMMSQEI